MKNPFLPDCRRKNCAELVYMGETIASEKQLCLKHFNAYIEQAFRQKVNPQNKRKTCKTCHAKIINKRNNTYCSNVCRQKGSRKIVDLSLKKLVKSYEWRRVERLIKSSPLGLNSINHESNLDDLFKLLLLCYYERSDIKPFFRFQHIIPIRLNGMNTENNIIIVPEFIKRTDNLYLINVLNYSCNTKPFYIPNSIINTCLKNKNLAPRLKTLITTIEHKPELEGTRLKENNNVVQQYINRIESLFLFYPFLTKSFSPLYLLGHLKYQSDVISQFHQFKPISSLIQICDKLKSDTNLSDPMKYDLFNLIALACYVAILNYSHVQYLFLNKINGDLTFLHEKDLLIENNLNNINAKLIIHITSYIKCNLRNNNLTKNNTNYSFIKRLYDKHHPKKR